MKITNAGRGIHQREIPGIERLRSLPNHWAAYTNLDLSLPHGSREIDVIMILDDRILVVDLKDWHGKIESSEGSWIQNGFDKGRSPVAKINENAKQIYFLLKGYLVDHVRRTGHSRPAGDIPRVQGLVILTATTDTTGIAPSEISSVYCLEPFLRMVQNTRDRIDSLRPVPPCFVATPLTSNEWKPILAKFFNVATGAFRPGHRRYGGYRAVSDNPCFSHKSGVFTEFDVEEETAARAPGILRRWDFGAAEPRFQTEQGRSEIAGRERSVIAWLNDRNSQCETAILQPRSDDPEKGVGYWEIFEKRRRLKRLSDFVDTEAGRLSKEGRLELARQILAQAKTLHDLNAIHLDLGPHSIWLESPSTVRLSHLMAARFPEARTLGDMRYQFLSSSTLPEHILGGADSAERKDVFLLGCAIHQLLLGSAPSIKRSGEPPEWVPDLDVNNKFAELHTWFEKALSWEPANRFRNADAMLGAFNQALTGYPSARAIIEGLERFQTIRSQLQLVKEYPPLQELRDDDRVAMWVSEHEGKLALVKMWKRMAWGDQGKEAPRILDFLMRAQGLAEAPPAGCAVIRRAVWLGDAIVVIQDFIHAANLADSFVKAPDRWRDLRFALLFARELAKRVTELHERKIAHGDLKPQNILDGDQENVDPCLIDLLDFSAQHDGEMHSTAYTPATGGRFERDRFAVTRITEEILAHSNLTSEQESRIRNAIDVCRCGPPENATLLPLLEELEELLNPRVPTAKRRIMLSFVGSATGPVLADEGCFGLRRAPDRPILFIRGACEELEIHFDDSSRPLHGRRRSLDQKKIQAVTRYEFAQIAAEVEITSGKVDDFQDAVALLNDPAIQSLWNPSEPISPIVEEPTVDDTEKGLSSEEAADVIGESVAREALTTQEVDVPFLWRRLIDAERELTIEGVAIGDSTYRAEHNRHIVPFTLESGTFDFDRDDRVMVERLQKSDRWANIGTLELSVSGPEHVAINSRQWSARSSDRLVFEGQRLRFRSHFELTSHTRRESATQRLLSRQAIVRDLIDIFDPRSNVQPSHVPSGVDCGSLMTNYALNDEQARSLADVVRIRPLSLLQGPPGTGKTRFIGALVHFALTSGLARNVLLASQSHEAVNNAAEAVLELFGGQDISPSILRVGHENAVSERLLPFHVARVEGLYKDRFRATIKERLRVVAQALGIPASLSDAFVHIDRSIRPIVEKISFLSEQQLQSDGKLRLAGLKETLHQQLASIDLRLGDIDVEDREVLGTIIAALVKRDNVVAEDRAARFFATAKLASDVMGSVSTRERSFETFLAGTRQIVTGTCVGLGRSSLGLTSTPFDLVVVDEAARCTASELAVPIQAGRWIVLVGDQAQLEPLHRNEVVQHVAKETLISKREITRSDFERVFLSQYGSQASCRLTKQYRMAPAIGQLASAAFYDGALKDGGTTPIIDPTSIPAELGLPLMWVATDSHGDAAYQRRDKAGGYSLSNEIEADLIVSLIKTWDACAPFQAWLEQQTKFTHVIGVICTYAAQSVLLRAKLRYANLSETMRSSVKIDTVDSYQGKENPIVLLSLVRNNADGALENDIKTIRDGFMARPNRINVAITRAMDHLIFIGAKSRWPRNGPMSRVVKAFDSQVERGTATVYDATELQAKLDAQTAQPTPSRKRNKAGDTSPGSP